MRFVRGRTAAGSSRVPDFERKASRVLDLYEGRWQGTLLSPRDCVVCADEKTSVQARRRCHTTLPAGLGRAACAGVWTAGGGSEVIEPAGAQRLEAPNTLTTRASA